MFITSRTLLARSFFLKQKNSFQSSFYVKLIILNKGAARSSILRFTQFGFSESPQGGHVIVMDFKD